MEDFSLKDSQRNGNIPTWFGKLDQIWLLDLDSNQLDGSIPTEIGGMANLRFLLLNRNFLTGTIPSELGNLNVLGRCIPDYGFLSLKEKSYVDFFLQRLLCSRTTQSLVMAIWCALVALIYDW